MTYDHDLALRYDTLKKKGTGSHDDDVDYKYIVYKLDRYDIKVKLTPDNRFVGVEEVKVSRDFMTNKEKSFINKYHDVTDYYQD